MANKNEEQELNEQADVETGELPTDSEPAIGNAMFDADGNMNTDDPKWDTVEGGMQFSFDEAGDWIQGIVTGISSTQVQNNNGDWQTLGKYTILAQKGVEDGEEIESGELRTVIGTYGLDESLKGKPDEKGEYPNAIPVNTVVKIEFKAWDETRSGNRFRQFEIKKAFPKPKASAPAS